MNIQSIPADVRIGVEELLERKVSQPVTIESFSYAGGGCINRGGRLQTSVGTFFIKWNDALKFPRMFEVEAKGLSLLSSTKAIAIPSVVGHADTSQNQFIVMDFIEQGAQSKNYWKQLGQQLAELHKNGSENFGLDHQNYIGSLMQFNDNDSSWVQFFIHQRLAKQVKLAVDTERAEKAWIKKFERLYQLLPSMLPEEKPSLLHGDLWSGNLMINSQGDPCLIDPAVYYGNREIELAFTRLFGGFENAFYNAYHNAYPVHPEFSNRIDIYNLYPLLVHTNLFGGHYREQVNAIVNSFI
jgi:fructosamine-3-kinase